jgi:hypothetical protein
MMPIAITGILAAIWAGIVGVIVYRVVRVHGATFFSREQKDVALIYRLFGATGLAVAGAGMAFVVTWAILHRLLGPQG